MFFISKSVADEIKSLGRREDVRRELEAIRAVPGFELYANAIAEGVGEGHGRERENRHHTPVHEPPHGDAS